ncbi:MAG TPA: hypothetical protein PK733_13910 [Clostridiales bacterium]|nr:hypothetical protein [Clostridiales bacterium]
MNRTLDRMLVFFFDLKLWLGAFTAFAVPLGFSFLFKWIREKSS